MNLWWVSIWSLEQSHYIMQARSHTVTHLTLSDNHCFDLRQELKGTFSISSCTVRDKNLCQVLSCVNTRSDMSEFWATWSDPFCQECVSVMRNAREERTHFYSDIVRTSRPDTLLPLWSVLSSLPTACHLITWTTLCGFASTETLASRMRTSLHI